MIIFLKGKLETLNYFIDKMAIRTKDAVFLDTTIDSVFFQGIDEIDSKIDENMHVITFNNAGVNFTINGVNYWEFKNVKLHNIQVDAPIWYMSTLDLQLSCMQIVSIDGYHNKFIKNYYPIYSKSIFVAHGGGVEPKYIKDYDDREIEVLYLGGKQGCGNQRVELPMFADKGKALYELITQLMVENPNLSAESIMEIYIQEMAPELTERMQLICIYAVYMEVVRNIRGMYQEKIMETLAQAGIPVTIYSGGGWYKLAEKYPGIITVRERVSSDECIRLIGNSKICLNIQPWFKDGAHERVFNAMLNGAVCVTDTSEYLLRNFTSGKDIVFYELEHLEQLAEDVKYLLTHPECAKAIITNQRKRAANHTWADRLDEIIGSQSGEE